MPLRGAALLRLEAYPARVGSLLRARWQAIAAFGLLLASVEATRAWSGMRGDPREFVVPLGAWLLIEVLTLGTGAVLGPLLAEAAGWRGWRRALMTIALTFAGVGAGVAAIHALAGKLLEAQVQAGAIVSADAFALSIVWFFSMAGLLFAAYVHVSERQVATTRAAQEAELERAGAQRAVMESRLKVLQARIEPEFLFSTLEQVRALQQREPASAERTLDDLILYLRATLPRMRGEASTIGGEIELVRSYLAVLRTLHGEPLRVEICGSPDVAGRPFPPMVLLPLVRAMMMDDGEFGRRTGFGAAVTTRATTAHITLVAEGGAVPEAWRGETLTGIRDTLQVACGAGCAIITSSEGDRHSASIVVASPVDPAGYSPTPGKE